MPARVAVCDVVLAEVATAVRDGAEVLGGLEDDGHRASTPPRPGGRARRRDAAPLPRSAAASAQRTVPDFLVGAHALLQCSALITRDAGFFRDYFKGLKVIVPKAS